MAAGWTVAGRDCFALGEDCEESFSRGATTVHELLTWDVDGSQWQSDCGSSWVQGVHRGTLGRWGNASCAFAFSDSPLLGESSYDVYVQKGKVEVTLDYAGPSKGSATVAARWVARAVARIPAGPVTPIPGAPSVKPPPASTAPGSPGAIVTRPLPGPERSRIDDQIRQAEERLRKLKEAGDKLGREYERLKKAEEKLAKAMRERQQLEQKNLPAITGTAAVGMTLRASPGRWSGGPTRFSYRWLRCNRAGSSCSAIAGAGGRSYTVAAADQGDTLRVQVTADGANGSGHAESMPTRPIPVPAPKGTTTAAAPSLPCTGAGVHDVSVQLASANGSTTIFDVAVSVSGCQGVSAADDTVSFSLSGDDCGTMSSASALTDSFGHTTAIYTITQSASGNCTLTVAESRYSTSKTFPYLNDGGYVGP